MADFFFLNWKQKNDIKATITARNNIIKKTTPKTDPQRAVKLLLSIFAITRLTQSSDVSDSNSVGQVESTLYTTPLTVSDGPLLTQEETNPTRSSAVYVPVGPL